MDRTEEEEDDDDDGTPAPPCTSAEVDGARAVDETARAASVAPAATEVDDEEPDDMMLYVHDTGFSRGGAEQSLRNAKESALIERQKKKKLGVLVK